MARHPEFFFRSPWKERACGADPEVARGSSDEGAASSLLLSGVLSFQGGAAFRISRPLATWPDQEEGYSPMC